MCVLGNYVEDSDGPALLVIQEFYNLYLGIDPGLQGGYALVSQDSKVIMASPLPLSTIDEKKTINSLMLYENLKRYVEHIKYGAIELVHAMPKQGVVSTFTFGKGYGAVLSVLDVLKINYTQISPQRWKKEVLGEVTSDKDKSIEYAKKLDSNREYINIRRNFKPHDGVAEAICLAIYARKTGKDLKHGRVE